MKEAFASSNRKFFLKNPLCGKAARVEKTFRCLRFWKGQGDPVTVVGKAAFLNPNRFLLKPCILAADCQGICRPVLPTALPKKDIRNVKNGIHIFWLIKSDNPVVESKKQIECESATNCNRKKLFHQGLTTRSRFFQVDFTAKPTYWRPLYPPVKLKLGELLVSLTYLPAKNTLTIGILKAKNLKAKDINGKSGEKSMSGHFRSIFLPILQFQIHMSRYGSCLGTRESRSKRPPFTSAT